MTINNHFHQQDYTLLLVKVTKNKSATIKYDYQPLTIMKKQTLKLDCCYTYSNNLFIVSVFYFININ